MDGIIHYDIYVLVHEPKNFMTKECTRVTRMFERIDTVFLSVQDFDRAITWYTETLGFPVRWRDDNGGYAALDIGETPLTLRRVPQDQAFTPNSDALFNFYVKDARAAHQHLKEREVETGDMNIDGNVTWFWFKDPDGNRLEVCSF